MNRLFSKRRLLYFFVSVFGLLLFLAYVDTRTPSQIGWRAGTLGGIQVLSAPDLVLQELRGQDLWATRGFSVYRSSNGGPFKKMASVVPPIGPFWGGYSASLRAFFGYQEVAEVFSPVPGLLLVFAAGEIHRIDLETGENKVVHQLRYFGPGKGRGVMPTGMTVDDLGYYYYAEYPRPPLAPEATVAVYRSMDKGYTWQRVFDFPSAKIKHIHAVQWDPYGGCLWVATGDRDHQSRIGYSLDRGETFHWIGEGSQIYRAVQLAFSETTVSWLTDTNREAVRYFRWSRADETLAASEYILPAPGFYVQQLSGERVLATTAERAPGLWLMTEHEAVPVFQWQGQRRRGPHPAVRLPRFSPRDGSMIYFNPLRTRDHGGDIYRMSRDELDKGVSL